MTDKEEQRFSSTVPRELVHRAAVSEVYLTGMEQVGLDCFTVYAQWPRRHYFYTVDDGQTESAMIIETFRQATVYIAHQAYGVSPDVNFLLPELHLTDYAMARHDSSRPADVTLRCSATQLKSSGGALTFMNVSAEISVGNVIVAKVQAGARIVNSAAYTRYRSQRIVRKETLPRLVGVRPRLIGRTTETSVLLGLPVGHQQWQLNADVSDPVFFDHYVDHVPGTALLEAARQAIAIATQRPGIDFNAVSACFHALVELSSASHLHAQEITPSNSLYHHWKVEITTEAVLNTTIVALCRREELSTALVVSPEVNQKTSTMKCVDARS